MAEEILTTAADVMAALGDIKGVAELTGCRAKTVWVWRSAGTFPSKTYVVLKAALAAKGKTAPDHLWEMMEPAERVEAAE